MKYLQKYETYIEMYIDDDDQLTLMMKYINENDSVKIKRLLDNGFDPNTKQGREPIVMNLINKIENININILKLFIDSGLDKEKITIFLFNELNWINSSTDKLNILESSRICIKSGANLFYEYGIYDDIFNMIEKKKKTANKFYTEKFVWNDLMKLEESSNSLINIIVIK